MSRDRSVASSAHRLTVRIVCMSSGLHSIGLLTKEPCEELLIDVHYTHINALQLVQAEPRPLHGAVHSPPWAWPPCAVSASSVQVRSMRPCCDFTADNRQANGSGELEHSTFRPPSECGWQRGPSAHATALPSSLFALRCALSRRATEAGKALARRLRATLSGFPWTWAATGDTDGA